MKNILKKLTNDNNVIFVFIFGFAIVFYLFNISFSDLWADEIYTKSLVSLSIPEMLTQFKNDLHPPLYFLGLKLFTNVFGLSALSLRLFSVIGVLFLLLTGYFAGQRVFGKHGAIYFCLMLLSIPMLASYSHEARMYTWAAFSINGVFIYSCIFMKSGKNRDLAFLFIFTAVAIYIHYYSMVAAFVANLFVFLYLIRTKDKKWLSHFLSLLLALLFFLPWLTMFLVQVKKVQHAFWVPAVSFSTILPCFIAPFTEIFWTTPYSISLLILIYSISVFTIYRSFTKSFSDHRIVLWLSIFIFLGTLAVVIIISIFSQPILYSRYVMAIVTMLIVPPSILLINIKTNWLKIVLMGIILFLGLRVSISSSYFSYGPYKQTVQYIANTYPDVHKVLHISEITAGPMLEYNGNSKLSHYWLKAKMSNVDIFSGIYQYNQPSDFLQSGEIFCVVNFNNMELNKENFDLALSESELIKVDTITDNKVESGNKILVYLLKYNGK